MARRVSPAAAAKKAAPQSAIGVLHPELDVQIADRVVRIREYGYVEGLKLQAAVAPFLDALYGLFAAADEPPSAHDIAELVGEHITTVQWLIAQALTPIVDDPQQFAAAVADNARWVGRLSEADGDALTTLWWGVNTGFFTRRFQRRLQARLAVERRAAQSASSTSTTP
jgi:hypothetical protein